MTGCGGSQTSSSPDAAEETGTHDASKPRGTVDDWLSAVCKLGTYQYDEPHPGIFATAHCQAAAPPGQSRVAVLQFSSDFMVRNYLARTAPRLASIYGYYTTGSSEDSAWMIALPPKTDRSYLAPLERFGFKIVEPPKE
jgi:hypothetical protein